MRKEVCPGVDAPLNKTLSRTVEIAALLFCGFVIGLSPPPAADDLPTLAVLPLFSQNVEKVKTNIIYDYIIDQVNQGDYR